MGEWFIDWFNTPEYSTVYKHRNEKDAEEHVDFIIETLNITQGTTVLDMACGAGRHSILFAKKGCRVTAFDYSEILLAEAMKNARQENLRIDFHRADMRDFSFDMQYDLILNLFTSFGYFEEENENRKVLQSAYNHLKEDGNFVLDYFNSEYLKKNLVGKSESMISGSHVIQERSLDNGRVKKRITVHKNNHTELYYEDVRLYSYDELKEKFTETGFKIRKIYGDFKGSDFDLETSPRVIIIAGK